MTGYKINFAANTITITQAFVQKANKINTDEYNLLKQIKADHPKMAILHNSRRRATKANSNKRLSYSNMERYINTYANADELMTVFERVKGKSTIQGNPYAYVKKWFIDQFPNYKELPSINETSVTPIMPIDDAA